MVHDLIPLKYPGFFKVDKRGFFNSILKKAKPNHFFIAPSISTKSDICHYYSIDPNKIFVVAGAVQDELFYPVKDQQVLKETLEKYQIQGPYILSLATLEPRKNILALIDAYIDLVQQYPWFEHKLVLGGAKGWGLENLRQKIKPYADKIILTGFIKETDLAAVYSGATAFVYPSLYEGFGFPPLEAMKCQTPVIVSSSSSLPEIVQNAGLYVSPTSPEDIASQILKLINNPSLQQELKDLGTKQAAKYSWSQTTQETFKVFETGLLQVR